MKLENDPFEVHLGLINRQRWTVFIFNEYGNRTEHTFDQASLADTFARQAMLGGASSAYINEVSHWYTSTPSRF